MTKDDFVLLDKDTKEEKVVLVDSLVLNNTYVKVKFITGDYKTYPIERITEMNK